MRGRFLRLLPWVVTAALLFLLFRGIPFGEVVAAARRGAAWSVPGGLACLVVIFFADGFATWKTFGWFLARMSFADVLRVRGASYLLAAINYNVGQAALVYFVHKTTGAPVMRGVATILLMMGINVLALLALATVGLGVAQDVPHAIVVLVRVAYAGLALYAVVLAIRPRWLATRPIFDVLLGAGITGHARALVVRLPHIAAVVTFQFVLFRGFHIRVPLVDALAIFPVVFLVAALPISIQGLGTTQATMVYFFARYASGDRPAQQATVLAASLAF
jgi:Lysylphosphatidylglycerol synthase TM region